MTRRGLYGHLALSREASAFLATNTRSRWRLVAVLKNHSRICLRSQTQVVNQIMYYVFDGSSHRAHAKIAALVRPVEPASHSCSNFRVLHSLPSSIYILFDEERRLFLNSIGRDIYYYYCFYAGIVWCSGWRTSVQSFRILFPLAACMHNWVNWAKCHREITASPSTDNACTTRHSVDTCSVSNA